MKKNPKIRHRSSFEKNTQISETGYRSGVADNNRILTALEERLNLQELILEISTLFINIRTEEIDAQIINALQRIATFLNADRCSYGEFSDDLNELRITHSYTASESISIEETILSKYLPFYTKVLKNGNDFIMEKPGNLPPEAAAEKAYCLRIGLKSQLTVPVTIGGRLIGALGFASFERYQIWPIDFIHQFHQLAYVFAQVLYRKRTEEKLVASYDKIKNLSSRLKAETEYLRSEIKQNFYRPGIIGESDAIRGVLRKIEQVAGTDSTVLITGETGTGKEVAARAIHQRSRRSDHLMVKVNCASLPAALIESELFGREKGAYTGALSRQLGRFEIADHSTIFLDEVSELSPDLQVKILQVIQDGTFERLGSSKTIEVDVRIIAATNHDLVESIREGKFREDLFYRLNVFPIEIPPLRERKEDVPNLALAFIDEFARKMNKKVPWISQGTMELLERYYWPGNIRELRNVIERAVIINHGEPLQVSLPKEFPGIQSQFLTLEESARQHIIQALAKANGHIKGRQGAAELLGLKPSTLYSKIKKLGITLG